MNVILFDDQFRNNVLPLTFTRPVADLRVGILTIAEKWEHRLKTSVSHAVPAYLSNKFKAVYTSDNLFINGAALPTSALHEAIEALTLGEALIAPDQRLIAVRTDSKDLSYREAKVVEEVHFLNYPEDIFGLNEQEVRADFAVITSGRTSADLPSSNTVTGPGQIFIEDSASVQGAMINPEGGCVYIGEGATVMEGSLIRGSFALCTGAALKLGAKIYGATTVGPHSKVGGEVSNSVIQAYSNKGHDGFLGNSVLGSWCNIGADSNNSNLKNNYAEVRLWDYEKQSFRRTGKQFCGLIMGDHSKCGINTMFNTGTVIGVSANIFGSGFPRNYVPSFAWGGASGFSTYQLRKVYETAALVMQRRGIELDDTEKAILEHIFNETKAYRYWELNKN